MSGKKQEKTTTSFSILDFYNVDPNLEENGAVMKLREDPNGEAFFIVRPFPNPDYTRKISEAFQNNAEVFKKGGDEADELDKRLTAEVFAETILVGCGGMAEEYSKEFAVKCMLNSRIRERILNFAASINNFRIKDEEIEEK